MVKITIVCVFGAMFTWFKYTLFCTYCTLLLLRLPETCRFLQSSSLWEVRRALIGQLSGALWLAEYLKPVTPLTIFGNTQHLHDNNTTARIKAPSLHKHLGGVMQHLCGGVRCFRKEWTSLKGVLLCFFHFLSFSQCVVRMFGHKTIYRVTNLKVHTKGRYLVEKNPFLRTTTNGSFGLQRCFPLNSQCSYF